VRKGVIHYLACIVSEGIPVEIGVETLTSRTGYLTKTSAGHTALRRLELGILVEVKQCQCEYNGMICW
jgi:hypothetical protein